MRYTIEIFKKETNPANSSRWWPHSAGNVTDYDAMHTVIARDFSGAVVGQDSGGMFDYAGNKYLVTLDDE